MFRFLLPLAALLFVGSPAAAQTISGCGTTAINKAESTNSAKLAENAACFDRAAASAQAAAKARRDRIAAMIPTINRTPTLVGQVLPVASGLNVPSLLGPVRVPGSMAPDVVGAFRFICSPGQVLADDPIMYPEQPGRAHLHLFFGNLGANANSTYQSLRTSGESTCMNPLNRSAYWMPAMLDGQGHVVRPDFLTLYYKRRPPNDPVCTTSAKECVAIPRGLRLIFGWDQTRPTEAQPENTATFNFKCVSNNRLVGEVSPNMVEPAKVCKPGMQLMGMIATLLCWDGVHLDTPDHRSHFAGMRRDASTGYQSLCPATHPKLVPQLTLGTTWTIQPGEDPTKWTLSSDHMKPGGLPGETFHSDYFEAWEDSIRDIWHTNCINLMLDCSDGNLGNGQILSRGPYYPYGLPVPRLVPVG